MTTFRIALAALTAVGVSVLADAAAPGTRSTQDRWQLVYERYDARRGEGGTGLEVVTSARARPHVIAREGARRDSFQSPSWSPGGRRIAFEGTVSGSHGLYVIRRDGTGLVLATRAHPSGFEWSPNGTSIAFVAACEPYAPRDGFEGCGAGRIEVTSRDGTSRHVVARVTGGRRRSDIRLLDWSPAGTHLLAIVEAGGRQRLVSVDVGSGLTRTLADSLRGGRLGGASWSSDGRRIAYARRCQKNRIGDVYCDLAVVRRDGNSRRLVYRRGPGVVGPSEQAPVWIPGTSKLVVPIWGDDGHTRIVDTTTGRSKRIAAEPWTTVAVSSDGSTIARLARSIGRPDVVILMRVDGTVQARFPLGREPTRNLSHSASASDHELWLP